MVLNSDDSIAKENAMAKKAAKKSAKKAVKKAVKKVRKKTAKKAVKKVSRTTHRSTGGSKLYAKRDGSGKFKDIQTFKRAHGSDVQRDAIDED